MTTHHQLRKDSHLTTTPTLPRDVKVGDTVRNARGEDSVVLAVGGDFDETVFKVDLGDGTSGYLSYTDNEWVSVVDTDTDWQALADLHRERRALVAFLDFYGDAYSTAADNAVARLAELDTLLGVR